MIPEMSPQELLAAVEAGEPLQVLDVRAAEYLARGRITWTASDTPGGAAFFNVTSSALALLGDPTEAGLDRTLPVAVVCAHGNASRGAALLLRSFGFEARSLRGGMAAWSVAHRRFDLEPPPGFHTLQVFERFANGRRTILLGAGDGALVVDPGRNLAPILESVRELGLSIRGVVDTHLHVDVYSGGFGLAEHAGCPYFLSADDAEGSRRASTAIPPEGTIACGAAWIGALSTPGHTAGSVTLVAGDLFLTGDFLLCDGIGRVESSHGPALADSLRAAATWPASGRVVPSYGSAGLMERPLAALEELLRRGTEVAAGATPVPLDAREQALRRANLGLETPDQATVLDLEVPSRDLRLEMSRWTEAC
jgi:glyoxylase-like metal-dependent hydrolase (beta-lactamase superfamily II)